ncbi:MAG: hypothetical protein H7333_06395 [Bdellovibrionales bacterium]|nr:hypothetical protein [Oligoflexia bacterium]
MRRFINKQILLIIVANVLTFASLAQARTEIPPCPVNTERSFMPDSARPSWAACKDAKGLYQGLLIQFSGQTEIIRIAGVKDSLRQGREIRFGLSGTLEERTFRDGHLDGPSFIFKAESTLGRVLPAKTTPQDWQNFSIPPKESILKPWLKSEPVSTLEFSKGRIVRLQFEAKDYQFRISKDERIFSVNHPEMKELFFIDPEPLWLLNGSDLKAALNPGFGSCKKYSGPVSRFGRHYDHMLFKREVNEKKFENGLKEIRDRFINFCVPKDIRTHLGQLECPPQLPTLFSATHCLVPISDQLRIPYEPKYFAFEFTMGHSPEEVHEVFRQNGLLKFLSDFNSIEDTIKLSPKVWLQVKRTGNGVLFRPLERNKEGKIVIKKESQSSSNSTDWWEWHVVPGY